jgi:hypothetical protein
MFENLIEPEETKFIPIDTIFENIPIRPKDKEWIHSMLFETEIPGEIQADLENSFGGLVKKSDETSSNSFKVLFLFYYNRDNKSPLYIIPDYFDESKLSYERINILSELFTQKQDDKPVIFQPNVADILDGIRYVKKIDPAFSIAFDKKKQEIRAESSLSQRTCYYIKLQNLQKRIYETGEKTVTLTIKDEIYSLIDNIEYSMQLIGELEEIYEHDNVFGPNLINLPFLLYGKKKFKCIVNAFALMFLSNNGNLDRLMEKIEIPKWNNKNYIHEIFFELANVNKKMSIIDKVLDGIDAAKVFSIFFDYILNPNRSFFRELLNDKYSNLIEPIRNEIVYLDRLVTSAIIYGKNPPQIFSERCQVLIDYIKYIDRKDPDHKASLLRELSLLKPEGQENNIIRDVQASLPNEFIDNKKTPEEAFIAALDWFKEFSGAHMISSPRYYISEFTDKGEIIYKNLFNPFSDDDEFICRFLSIPQAQELQSNKDVSKYWVIYFLACWIVKHGKKPDTSNMFKEASRLLMQEKIIFPQKIINFILSYNDFNILTNKNIAYNGETNEADLLLYKIFAAINESDNYQRILETIQEPEELFSLYFIRYNYTHGKFVYREFIDRLLTLKKPVQRFLQSFRNDEDEIYSLIIIKNACKDGFLSEQKVIPVLYERAIQETEPSCIELFAFLKFRSYFPNFLFIDSAEQIKARCGKMLRNFRFIEQEEFPEDERNLHYNCAWLAVNFLFEKTRKAWKAIKPLIIAFRASKKVLLENNLESLLLSELPLMITRFFNIGDQKILKELRADMANDFIDYFTPIKEKENGKIKYHTEQYTEFECKEKGFNPDLREPSPLWRYAYMRALADLRVKRDKKRHYFHRQIEIVSQTDPSEKVKEAAMKTLKRLDTNRSGITGANHKKCLYEAFWWLKYAHMFSLGKEVDSKKANDLRIKEWK